MSEYGAKFRRLTEILIKRTMLKHRDVTSDESAGVTVGQWKTGHHCCLHRNINTLFSLS